VSDRISEARRARIQADIARNQLVTTLGEIQHRLAPSTIANDVWDGARERGTVLANDAVELARTRPVATAGVFAGVLAFLARKPLIRMFSRNRSSEPEVTAPALTTDETIYRA
jgi:hypothetical protein